MSPNLPESQQSQRCSAQASGRCVTMLTPSYIAGTLPRRRLRPLPLLSPIATVLLAFPEPAWTADHWQLCTSTTVVLSSTTASRGSDCLLLVPQTDSVTNVSGSREQTPLRTSHCSVPSTASSVPLKDCCLACLLACCAS